MRHTPAVITAVNPDKVISIWAEVAPLIDAAYAQADERVPYDILEQFSHRKMVLWVGLNEKGQIIVAATTVLFGARSGLVCKIVGCAGSQPNKWKESVQLLEAYAKAEGCCKIQIDGRLGWTRVLQGYEVARHIMEKVIVR